MDFEIGRYEGWVVEHCYSCSIPGYLIVSPIARAESMDALSAEACKSIGPLLSTVTALVKRIVVPERVYCAQFGEEQSQLHFHVFPRGRVLTDEYLAAFPEHTTQIRGPIVLDWARDRYRCDQQTVYEAVSETMKQMRDLWASQRAAHEATEH